VTLGDTQCDSGGNSLVGLTTTATWAHSHMGGQNGLAPPLNTAAGMLHTIHDHDTDGVGSL
jgi:hypothetical protein